MSRRSASQDSRRTHRTPSRGVRASAVRISLNLCLIGVIAVFAGPFLWILAIAFDRDPTGATPWPNSPTLDNFQQVFLVHDFAVPLRNSLTVAAATTLLVTVAVGLAGYALSRLPFHGREGVAYAILLLQTMPLAVTMVPIYDLSRRLGLRDTYLGLVLVHAAIALPFLVWLMKDFFDSVPRELEEAAWVDGASQLRAWFEILVPAVTAGLAVVAGYAFLTAWSEVLLVIILIDQQDKRTVALAFFEAFRSGQDVPILAAMSILYILPVLAVFAVTGRVIARGIAASAAR